MSMRLLLLIDHRLCLGQLLLLSTRAVLLLLSVGSCRSLERSRSPKLHERLLSQTVLLQLLRGDVGRRPEVCHRLLLLLLLWRLLLLL